MELIWHFKGGKLVYIETALSLAEELLVVKLAVGDLLNLSDLEPLYALALLPEATLCLLARNQICS